MSASEGLLRAGEVVVLTGPALRTTLQGVLIAIRQRKMSGLPTDAFEVLAGELTAAMAANGHSDMRSSAISDSVLVEPPTVPVHQAAVCMGVSLRQARRLAPRLGGRKVGGCWFVDETALREHVEGRRQ